MDHVRGEKTKDRQTLEPSAVSGPSPPLFLQWYLIMQTECGTTVAKSLCDVAISAESPGSSPRRNSLLEEEIERSGRRRKLSDAAFARRRHYVFPRRASPRRRNKTDALGSSKRSCLYCEVAMVIFLAELPTHEGRTRRGREACTKRQFGVVT